MPERDASEPVNLGLTEERQAQVGAAVMEQLFGVAVPREAPRHYGRYEVVERLGKGAMGEVFLARDPELGREVALKVLLADRGSDYRAYLVAEAKVMARLFHPHVVAVFDIGADGDRLFVAMERMMGGNLRQWQDAEPRAWSQTVRAYRDAAKGLAAAHAEGIVHRDFKPDNVMLGEHGEVKVTDFGLARIDPDVRERIRTTVSSYSEGAEPEPNVPSRLSGTPAYMAPEVIRGANEDPRSDQFGFFVALYEGLYGQRPFEGASVFALFSNIATGQRRPSPSARIPGRLRAIVERGLSPDPDARFPSMARVAEVLDRCLVPPWRRVVVPVAVGVGACIGVGVSLANPGAEPCSGSETRLAPVWHEERRAGVSEALLGTGRPYAQEVQPLVDAALGDYAEQWASQHRQACLEYERKELSDDLYDRRMACLELRLVALGSAAEVLAGTDAQTLMHAAEVVEGLPAVRTCAQRRWLEASAPPPSDEQAAAVEALEQRLVAVQALERAGRHVDARTEAEAIEAEAEALGYRPTLARARLVRGRIMLQTKAFGEAAAPLLDAALLSLELGLDGVALEAMARHLYASAMSPVDGGAVLYTIPFAEALARRFEHAAFGRALLLNNAGTAYLGTGKRAEALDMFKRALVVKNEAELSEVELTNILANLALLDPDGVARREAAGRAASELQAALGPSHSMTLGARYVESHTIEDPQAAYPMRAAVCDSYARDHPEEPGMLAECRYSQGLLALELGRPEDAAVAFEGAASVVPEDPAVDAELRAVASGYAALLQGRPDEALARFEGMIATADEHPPWWIARHVARAQLGIARIRRQRGEAELEREALGRAAVQLRAITEVSYDADLGRALAAAEAALE